jgi:flagellin-like protein
MTYIMREDAISPVIGVILMVAITVILAAIIAVFVFNMAGSTIDKPMPYAGVIVRQVGNDITLTYAVSPPSGDIITNLSVRVNGEVAGYIENPAIGETLSMEDVGTSGPDTVVVVATFGNGAQSVVLNTHV